MGRAVGSVVGGSPSWQVARVLALLVAVAVAGGCGGGTAGGGTGGTIDIEVGGAGGRAGAGGTAAAGAGGAATAGAGGHAGASAKGGAGGRAGTPPVTGTLAVTIDGTPMTFPSLVGAFNGTRVDISGYTTDLMRSFAVSVYPAGMASGSFSCALGGQTSMTMSYSVSFVPMTAPATAAGCTGTFTMIPTSMAAGGRFVGTFSGMVGTSVATSGMVDVTFPPN
jgi:hypothetical protein